MKDRRDQNLLMRIKNGYNEITGDLDQFKSWRGGWRRVFICAPFDGPLTRSREEIWWYCMFAKNHEYLPIAPDLYYSEFMYPGCEEEDVLVRKWILEDLKRCDEIWVFGDRITPEMKRILRSGPAKSLNVMQFPACEELLEFMKEEDEDE